MKKEESHALQGIAALLVVFHHCFMLTPLFADGFLSNPALTEQFAKSARICLGICAFVSGYGLFCSFVKEDEYLAEYKNVGRRILRLYGRFWYVLAVTLIAEILLFGRQIAWAELPGNITAFNPTYNTTWWYVREYMYMLLLVPLIKAVLQGGKKKRAIAISVALIAVIILDVLFVIPNGRTIVSSILNHVQVAVLITFFEGYLAAYIQNKLCNRDIKRIDNPTVIVLVGLLIAVISYGIRVLLSVDGGDSKPDILVMPFFVFGTVLALRYLSPVKSALAFIGKNLLYIWLIHGLVWKESTFILLTYTNPVIFYITIFAISLILAIILGYVERLIVSSVKKITNSVKKQ